MERKSNISQYRGRLDKTLTSYDLENEEGLKVLVKNQILQSSHCEIEEYLENIVERRTKDVFNFLQMLKSASANDYEVSKSRETPRSGWKLKQDTEDYRVMYRQGPQGTPFHTLLVEGYVDGPLDVCLCISWESTLYNKWWPQTNIPTFKIISSDCLQKVRIGEQISLVRMKVPWPLSAREVVVHFFEFEYFQDDLVVVLLNSISDLESIDRSTHGFSKDGIPDAQDVVRIDVVGGFALQKVTADRSYFRTITNLDMKLDFVPPSFINFISRQLIGSGFRLYKKEVASVSRGDEDFGKALKDQLYNRIREILYSDNKQKRALELGDTKNDVETFHEERVLEVLSDHHATETFPEDVVVEDDHHATETFSEDAVVEDDHHATETFPEDVVVEDHKAIFEIEEIAEEDIEQSGHLEEGGKQICNPTTTQIEEKPCVNNKIIGVSPQVKQALETLDKVISICREYRLGPQTRSPEFTHKGSFDLGKNREKELRSLGNGQIFASDQACVDALKNETVERALHEPRNSSSSHCSRRMGSNSCSRETCHNKIAPASSEENLLHASETHQQTASFYSTHATTERTIVGGTGFDDKLENVDANAICKDGTKTGKHKKPKFCCFHLFSGSLMS